MLILILCHNSFSQVTQEWAARFNGPEDSSEYAISMTVDQLGNVYVTGNSYGSGTNIDYLTIKYSSAGIQLWVQRFNGQGNTFDAVSSIAVDIAGNVYVTGGSGSGISPISDYATIKYNSAGDQLWVAGYDGPGHTFEDFASSIAADDSGNVYVTGHSFGNGSSTDFATIKLNSSGIQQWAARYNGTGNSSDEAVSISVDSSGNVYVGGSSIGSGTDYDYLVIKYNSAGDSQWVARYNGPGNSGDNVTSIKLDYSGNVYVTGESNGSGTYKDYATIKYNSNGIQQWVSRYNGIGNGFDYTTSLAVDSAGNAYVTGDISGSQGSRDYATLKYNTGGIQQWVAIYSGTDFSDDYAHSIALDDLGNVYVTGGSDLSLNNEDYATIKYNSTGDSQWVAIYNGPANSNDWASSIALDGIGNVYVTGSSIGIGTSSDYATIKYSQSTGIVHVSSEVPEKFSLFQNFPNPFNPVTNLEFGISDLGFVSLKVYDILGKELATLVNEKLSPGKYKAEFDGSGLPNGVYFYRLTAGEFTETKRMMLIKYQCSMFKYQCSMFNFNLNCDMYIIIIHYSLFIIHYSDILVTIRSYTVPNFA
ncbi:MAG: SBBP repeat-containing protein [Ignavibacteria bacterium]|nr:SBBP repeat-containing protein [Ignavibacteria bacterium]